MQARVRPNVRYATLILFSGVVFTKSEYRDVPPGREREAEKDDRLEILPVAVLEPAPVPVSPAVIELPKPINSFVIEEVEWEEPVSEPEPAPAIVPDPIEEIVPEPVKKSNKKARR
jgi:hypothetical protein